MLALGLGQGHSEGPHQHHPVLLRSSSYSTARVVVTTLVFLDWAVVCEIWAKENVKKGAGPRENLTGELGEREGWPR